MSNVYTDASHSDACVDIIHVEDFPLIHRQLNAPNSGRTKRGARLASDEIYVETQWTLKVSMRPPASSSSSPSIWRLFPWRSGPGGDVSDLGLGDLLFQGRRFIKVSDKCRNTTLEFTFQPRAADA